MNRRRRRQESHYFIPVGGGRSETRHLVFYETGSWPQLTSIFRKCRLALTNGLPTFSHAMIGWISLLGGSFTVELQAIDVPGRVEISLQHEIQHAIDRGLARLQTSQNSNGWWSTPDQPAVSALALAAFMNEPQGRYRPQPDFVQKGYANLLRCVRPDGGIHRSNLVTYNTSISMMGLLAARRPEYDPILRRGRQFLVGLQRDFGEKGKIDDVNDGGVGYGTRYEHSDMGNTLAALEAMYHTRHLAADRPKTTEPDLNWKAAIQFLQNCQNLPTHNTQLWVSAENRDLGGFVYYPGHSMAGGTTNATTGKVALRSYGSISYGGMLSYLYANLERNDPRVIAVFDWLRGNFSLEENPGLGPQGYYFYLHTMGKALQAYGVGELLLKDGRTIAWRHDLALRLINLQQHDGSWANENNRWWEKDSDLVTAYAILTLELLI